MHAVALAGSICSAQHRCSQYVPVTACVQLEVFKTVFQRCETQVLMYCTYLELV